MEEDLLEAQNNCDYWKKCLIEAFQSLECVEITEDAEDVVIGLEEAKEGLKELYLDITAALKACKKARNEKPS